MSPLPHFPNYFSPYNQNDIKRIESKFGGRFKINQSHYIDGIEFIKIKDLIKNIEHDLPLNDDKIQQLYGKHTIDKIKPMMRIELIEIILNDLVNDNRNDLLNQIGIK